MQNEYVPPRRFVGIRRKVSLFFVTALISSIGIVLFVSYKQGAFVRHTTIHFYASDAFGISRGMAVKLFGLPVGEVKNMEISDQGVKVDLAIISGYIARLPKGSRARLVREGYVGAANIQFVPASEPGGSAQPLAEGDEIGFIPARGVAEMVDDFKNQLTPVVNELRKILAEMNRPGSDLRKSIEGVKEILQELPATNREVRQVLRDVDHTMLTVGRQAETTLGSAERVSAQAEKQLPALAAKLATTLDSLSDAAMEVRNATHRNGEAIHEVLVQTPALLREGESLVRDGQEIVGAARNVWPFSDVLDPPSLRTLPVDSFESGVSGGASVAAQARP